MVVAGRLPFEAPTFHEFSSQWYADGLPGWASNTAAAYEYELSLLNGHLAHHLLPEITYDEIKAYVRAARGYRTRRGEPLKTETIRKTLTRLGTILREARRSKLIAEVPEIPRLTIPKAERPRRTYLDTAERITALLDAGRALDAEAERYGHVNRHAMLATLVFAGLRISELLALQWRDVNLGTGWIEIPAAKTEAGERRIKVRPVLRETLATIKPADADPDALVFPTETGQRHSASNVRQRVLTKARGRAAIELPPLTPHSLRRTFASVLLAIGVPVPAVQRELGHRDPKLTLAVYAQVMEYEPEQIEALKALVEGVELPVSEPAREVLTP